MGHYDTAQICLNGHVITDTYHRSPAFRQGFCDKCGASTIFTCPQCGAEIKGDYHADGVTVIGTEMMKAPPFCHACGKPYPWASEGSDARTPGDGEEHRFPEPLATGKADSDGFPAWGAAAGFALLVATVIFLMALVAFDTAGYPISCTGRGPIVLIFALTTGAAVAFLGGSQQLSGNIHVGNWSPVKVALTGGVAAIVIVLLIGFSLYATDTCGGGGLDGGLAPPRQAEVAVPCKDVYVQAFRRLLPAGWNRPLFLDFEGQRISLAESAADEHSVFALHNYDPGEYDVRIFSPESTEAAERIVETTRIEERVLLPEFFGMAIKGVPVPVVDRKTELVTVPIPEAVLGKGRVRLTNQRSFLLRLREGAELILEPTELGIRRLKEESSLLAQLPSCDLAQERDPATQ